MDEASLRSVISMLVTLCMFISQARLLSKAGEGWWKLLIPFYGSYALYKIARCVGLFWATLFAAGAFIGGLFWLVPAASDGDGDMLLGAVAIVFFIILFVFAAIYCVHLARAFGKGGGYALGLLLLPPVFIPLLAFGPAAYIGAPASAIGYSPDPVHPAGHFTAPIRKRSWRSECGSDNDLNVLYCPRCGMRMP